MLSEKSRFESEKPLNSIHSMLIISGCQIVNKEQAEEVPKQSI
jgi:hypothetical protein